MSEGQAYAMLLAEAGGDDEAFGRVWRWTRDHLQRDDGLFAFHADRAGRILDDEPASDADLLIAWALLRHDGRHPTYYGGAWAALGRVLLTGSALASC